MNTNIKKKSQGFWDWLFGDDDETSRYERERYSRLGSRSFVLTAHADDMEAAERARTIMDNANALDADEYDRTLAEYNERFRDNHDDAEFNNRIGVIREEMRVGKEEVETGGVNIRSRIVEKPVEESVRLRDERVYVKRNKVDREATDADFLPGSNFYERISRAPSGI
ncbi:DUF2382 domain-containing protein [Flavobacteriaceae bacterium Ap0902]|nr:DUF2382 domain-containing protein [Flavobacteriaceae bacterium Ap0902]